MNRGLSARERLFIGASVTGLFAVIHLATADDWAEAWTVASGLYTFYMAWAKDNAQDS